MPPKLIEPDRAVTDPDWRLKAACRDVLDPEIFFADPSSNDRDEAEAICMRCPVKGDCLAWAIAAGCDHGVWGGWTAPERKTLTLVPPGGRV